MLDKDQRDYMLRATAADGQLRAFVLRSSQLVEKARQAHGLSPVATAALGRLLSGGVMMGKMLKNAGDVLTLQIKCDGPIGGLTVTAGADGDVKGYVINPVFEGYARADHKLDVGGALGYGTLTVIKDMGLKEPFAGTTELVTGEIAEDLTYYFATSEQTPSSVGLGVLLNREDGSVSCAGGFILQLMPGASEETISTLERNLSQVKSVTAMLSAGLTPEDMLSVLCDGLGFRIEEKCDCRFHCDCSKQRIEKVLLSLGEKGLKELLEEEKPVEVKCHFCNTAYSFTKEEITRLAEQAIRPGGEEDV
ncbi:MAG: Hsp33 family molecular chaperone HslO [Lachnospiraceae bacterium]|nr:Hsp33 family molecular chaperone HslO [Lachnospiraceae bacterium]